MIGLGRGLVSIGAFIGCYASGQGVSASLPCTCRTLVDRPLLLTHQRRPPCPCLLLRHRRPRRGGALLHREGAGLPVETRRDVPSRLLTRCHSSPRLRPHSQPLQVDTIGSLRWGYRAPLSQKSARKVGQSQMGVASTPAAPKGSCRRIKRCNPRSQLLPKNSLGG